MKRRHLLGCSALAIGGSWLSTGSPARQSGRGREQLAFRVTGGAAHPPLLFIHGLACDGGDWASQMGHFAGRRRCIAPDLPGHGGSVAGAETATIEELSRSIVDLIDSLEVDRPVLVGHSLGCRVAMEVYRQIPGRVAGLVFVDGSHVGEQTAESGRAKVDKLLSGVDFGEFLAASFDDMFFDAGDSEFKARALSRAASLPEKFARSLFSSVVVFDSRDAPAILAAVRVPVLAVQSTGLIMTEGGVKRVPVDQPGSVNPFLDLLEARVRDLETVRISGPGHFPMVEAPAAVNAALEGWLERHFPG